MLIHESKKVHVSGFPSTLPSTHIANGREKRLNVSPGRRVRGINTTLPSPPLLYLAVASRWASGKLATVSDLACLWPSLFITPHQTSLGSHLLSPSLPSPPSLSLPTATTHESPFPSLPLTSVSPPSSPLYPLVTPVFSPPLPACLLFSRFQFSFPSHPLAGSLFFLSYFPSSTLKPFGLLWTSPPLPFPQQRWSKQAEEFIQLNGAVCGVLLLFQLHKTIVEFVCSVEVHRGVLCVSVVLEAFVGDSVVLVCYCYQSDYTFTAP